VSRTVKHLGASECARRLGSSGGLRLRAAPFVLAVRSRVPAVQAAVHRVYADYPLVDDDAFVDFEVEVQWQRHGLRPWRQLAVFRLDGEEPFNPLPADQAFPLLEWGINWCVYSMCHQYLIVHAAVLERGGRAVLLPAPSGSGKSTLCAALAFSGWRLLSDELALIDPASGQVVPHPRPISLKNASIDVIRTHAPSAKLGSMVADTKKGVVAHFSPPDGSVDDQRPAHPAWVVVPRYVAGASACRLDLERAQGFMTLVENSFNYDVLGARGFEIIAAVVDHCDCFEFEYSSPTEAVAFFNSLSVTGTDK
jgi:HprK-related kinase A